MPLKPLLWMGFTLFPWSLQAAPPAHTPAEVQLMCQDIRTLIWHLHRAKQFDVPPEQAINEAQLLRNPDSLTSQAEWETLIPKLATGVYQHTPVLPTTEQKLRFLSDIPKVVNERQCQQLYQQFRQQVAS